MLVAEMDHGVFDPALRVGILAIAALACFGLWVFIRWLSTGPTTPDPWDDEIAAAIGGEDATPLCHHCLAPHDPSLNFCPDCGAAVGMYTNWMPYPYVFSLGHVLRIGTSGDFKRSPLNIVGFVLLSSAEYTFFAPIYWIMLSRNTFRQRQSNQASTVPPADSAGPSS